MATIAIACGGTGGHLFPGIAVAEELRRRGHGAFVLVSDKPVDGRVLAGYPDLEAVRLEAVGWTGFNGSMFKFLIGLFSSYWRVRREFRRRKVGAVLGMGGFTSGPPVLAAVHMGLPVLLHESNAIPGKVTRWLSRRAGTVLLGLEECAGQLKGVRCVVTGTPVRSRLRRVDRVEARKKLGLDPDRPVLAVVGGSQGAVGLNRAVTAALGLVPEITREWQVVHLTGARDADEVRRAYQARGIRAAVYEFHDEMEVVYSASEFAVARAGASSLGELAFFGLPAVLVPYPHAAEDHQTANAGHFTRAGAAFLWVEDRNRPDALASFIRRLAGNGAVREAMSRAALNLSPAHAVGRIVEEVEHALR